MACQIADLDGRAVGHLDRHQLVERQQVSLRHVVTGRPINALAEPRYSPERRAYLPCCIKRFASANIEPFPHGETPSALRLGRGAGPCDQAAGASAVSSGWWPLASVSACWRTFVACARVKPNLVINWLE